MIYPNGNDPTDNEYGASPDDMPDADELDIDKFDKYIGARVILDDRDNDGGNIATKPIIFQCLIIESSTLSSKMVRWKRSLPTRLQRIILSIR